MSLRKIIVTRGSFPNEDAAMKLLYLALVECLEEMDDAGAKLERRVEPIQHFSWPEADARALDRV